jgi:hypothetical protein
MNHRVKPGGDERNIVPFGKTRARWRRENDRACPFFVIVGSQMLACRRHNIIQSRLNPFTIPPESAVMLLN